MVFFDAVHGVKLLLAALSPRGLVDRFDYMVDRTVVAKAAVGADEC
jgi:hypothetical protein